MDLLRFDEEKLFVLQSDGIEISSPTHQKDSEENGASPLTQKKTILVADNSPRWLKFLTNALGGSYEIVTVQSAPQAIKEIEKGNIDLVLTDVDMPGRGDELAKQSDEKFPNLPVIFHTSGYVASEYENLSNVKDVITKNDALPDEVLEAVKKVLPVSSGIQTSGGIDLMATDSVITTKGNGVEFMSPPELQGIDLNSFEGFVPVIINIVPVTDFMGLLGLNESDVSDEEKSILSQNNPTFDKIVALKD